jgi:transglycosylase-like protein
MVTFALITLICLAALAGTAWAHWPSAHRTGELQAPRVHVIYWLRGQLNDTLQAKCLPARRYGWKPAYRVPQGARPWVIERTQTWLRTARSAESRCVPWPWDALAECESGGNWAYNGPSGFDGGLQFLPSTWNTAKGMVRGASVYSYAWQAPAHVQVRVAQAWLSVTSWAQWPACSSALGLR